jgi:outer membrane protein TolC
MSTIVKGVVMANRQVWSGVIYILLFIMLSSRTLYATDLQSLDLATCIQIAMQKDQSLIAAEEGVKKAKAVLLKAKSAYYPQVMASSNYINLDEPYNLQNFALTVQGMGTLIVDRFDFSDDEMIVSEVGVELPLFTWGRITNMNRLAKRGVDIAKSKRKEIHDQVLNTVVNSYKQVVLARESRRYLMDTISEMELFYKTAKNDLKKGARNAPEKDVIQIAYDLDDMKIWLPELNKWETLSLEALKISMGIDAATPINIVGDTLDYPDFRMELDQLVSLAMQNRPELQALDDAVKSAKLQKKMAKVSNLPMFAAFAKKTWTSDDFDANEDSISAYGVGARMHLFDGFKGYAEYKEASYQMVQLQNQLDYFRKQVALQVQQTLIEVNEYYEQLKIREEARKKAIKQVKVVRKGYQYGITTVDDVNDAQVQKRWSDANWLFKKLEYVKAIAKLNQVVGEEVHPFR